MNNQAAVVAEITIREDGSGEIRFVGPPSETDPYRLARDEAVMSFRSAPREALDLAGMTLKIKSSRLFLGGICFGKQVLHKQQIKFDSPDQLSKALVVRRSDVIGNAMIEDRRRMLKETYF